MDSNGFYIKVLLIFTLPYAMLAYLISVVTLYCLPILELAQSELRDQMSSKCGHSVTAAVNGFRSHANLNFAFVVQGT